MKSKIANEIEKETPKELVEKVRSNTNCFLRNINRSYFHELSQEQIDKFIADKKNWGDIMREYKQPEWCAHPNALEGQMGCWSLIDLQEGGQRTKINNDYCKTCDCYKGDCD